MGYARVSTDEQTTRLQLDALKAVGCERIFEDKESGALQSRSKLDRALADLRAGDTLAVWKLDRLGRLPQTRPSHCSPSMVAFDDVLSVPQLTYVDLESCQRAKLDLDCFTNDSFFDGFSR